MNTQKENNGRLDSEKFRKLRSKLKKMHASLREDVTLDEERFEGEISADSEEAAQGKEDMEVADAIYDLESQEIEDVEQALERFAEGTYGICEDCGENIPIERLEIMPYTRFCVSCEEKEERARSEEDED